MMEHKGNDPEHENEIWWCMNHAAAQIQKVYRGYRTRGKFAMSFTDNSNSTANRKGRHYLVSKCVWSLRLRR